MYRSFENALTNNDSVQHISVVFIKIQTWHNSSMNRKTSAHLHFLLEGNWYDWHPAGSMLAHLFAPGAGRMEWVLKGHGVCECHSSASFRSAATTCTRMVCVCVCVWFWCMCVRERGHGDTDDSKDGGKNDETGSEDECVMGLELGSRFNKCEFICKRSPQGNFWLRFALQRTFPKVPVNNWRSPGVYTRTWIYSYT